MCCAYRCLATLEDGYGINLLPLATFAMEVYGDDECEGFEPKVDDDTTDISDKNRRLIARMHKAIAVLQFKLEAELIRRHPEWRMDDRLLLQHVDYNRGVLMLDGREYVMTSTNFPTVDPVDPYRLSSEEADLVCKLRHSFRVSDKLARHVKLLLSHGSMYGIYNSNLLFHASLPMNIDGSFRQVDIQGRLYKGRALMEKTEAMMRAAFNYDTSDDDRSYVTDFYWYLWCGPDSPLFDKSNGYFRALLPYRQDYFPRREGPLLRHA